MSRFKSILFASIVSLLSACALAPTPEDAFYRLEVSPPTTATGTPRLEGILEIDPFRADPLTSGRAMLYRKTDTPNRVYRVHYTFWMDAPAAMLQRESAEYLRAAGIAEQVVMPNARTNADFALLGMIVHLEQIRSAEPSVVIELELALVERGSRNLLHHGIYTEETATRGNDAGGAAEAFGRALSSILERFVADLKAN